uniref:Transmembrane protein n=2 Tax=Macrostomum lignano TaxID=282301 RepID=A0A1I8G3W5_9PLAT
FQEHQPEDVLFLPAHELPSQQQSSHQPYRLWRSSSNSGDCDIDDDSLLIIGSRVGSRVPPLLGWMQLCLALVGFSFWSASVAIRANSFNQLNRISEANTTVVNVNWSAFDVSGAFGFPLWCAILMLLLSILALSYARTSRTIALRMYRCHCLLCLLLHSVALPPLAVSWTQPQPRQLLTALQALSGLTVLLCWGLLLACVLCDHCVGKNVFQVAGLFLRALRNRGGVGSISELDESASYNSLTLGPTGRSVSSNEASQQQQQQRFSQLPSSPADQSGDDSVSREDFEVGDQFREQRKSLLTRQLLV